MTLLLSDLQLFKYVWGTLETFSSAVSATFFFVCQFVHNKSWKIFKNVSLYDKKIVSKICEREWKDFLIYRGGA